MPTRSLNVLITGEDKITPVLSKATKHTEEYSKKSREASEHVAEGFKKIHEAGKLLAEIGGITALTFGLKDVTEEAVKSEAEQKKLANTVKDAGLSWKAHGKEVDEWLDKTSRASGFVKSDLESALGNFIRTTGSVTKAQKLEGQAMDIARSKGIGLANAQSLLARVYNGSYTGLKRLGVAVVPVTKAQDVLKASSKKATDEQKAHAKALDQAATRTEALGLVQAKFGGQLKAFASSTAGAFDRAKASLNLFEERVGTIVLPLMAKAANAIADVGQSAEEHWPQVEAIAQKVFGRLRPTIDAITSAAAGLKAGIASLVSGFQQGQGSAVAIVSVLGGLTAGLVAATVVMKAIAVVTKVWTVAQAALNVVMDANPIGVVVVALAGLAAGLVIAYKKSETFRDIVNGVFTTVKAVAGSVVAWVTGAFKTVVDEVSQWKVFFETIAVGWKIVSTYWKAEFAVIVAVVKTAITVISTVVRAGMALLGPIVSHVWSGIKVIIKGALDIISGFVKIFGGVLKGDFGQIWDGVKQVFKGAWEGLKGATQAGIGTITDLLKAVPGKAVHALGDLSKTLLGAGQDLIGGMVAGIKAGIGAITGVAAWLKDQIVAAVKKAFGIHSPSTVMAELGGHMASGLIKGVLGGNIMGFIKSHLGGVTSIAGSVLGGIGGKIAGFFGGGKGGGGSLQKWLTAALAITGQLTPSNLAALTKQALSESAGNPKAINLWDSNAKAGHPSKGLLQTIDGTFNAYKLPGMGDIWNPIDNAVAAIRYMLATYGHIVGTGHGYASGTPSAAKGLAWVGEKGPELVNFSGGETVLSNANSLDAVKNQSKWLQSTWGKFASFLGQGAGSSIASYFAKVRMDNRIPFVGVAWDNEARKGTPDLLWPRWIWSDTNGQKALGLSARRQLLIHEMAHRFQNTKQVNAEWKSEGGAEAFARRVMDRIFGGRVSSKGDPYTPYAKRVEKELGAKWVMGGQFGRVAAGYALGTPGAAKGWAWVGERGPELMRMKGGETVLSHGDSMRAIGGYASGTVSPSVLAQIKKLQASGNTSGLSTTSAFTTMKGLTGLESAPVDAVSEGLRAQVALAALTTGLGDDITAAGAVLAHAQAAFNNAQAGGNSSAIADTAGDLKTAQDNLKALTDALTANTDALNGVRADLEKQRADDATRSLAVSQSQYGILAQAISDIANGGIGQRLGLTLSGMRAPAGAVSRL